MSKHSVENPDKTGKCVSFLDFWNTVATELGSSRLKINPNAGSIHRFIDCNSDHKEYLKKVIQLSYKQSECNHLRDNVNLECVLDILGETAYQLQGQQADDLLDIELLEEIAWLISERYESSLKLATTNQHAHTPVISLDKFKIRRSNAKL